MNKNISRLLIVASLALPAFAQIEQTHPELCGTPSGTVPPLPAMSISVDRSEGSAKLFLGGGFATKAIDLPGVIDAVPEVCPLPNGQYLIFGETYNGTNMLIVDAQKGAVVDQIVGFDPAMSPDQRRIAFRKFYPRHHDLPFSEEYLLYDLSKNPSQNRAPGIDLTDWENVGRAIFPAGWKNAMFDTGDIPKDRLHSSGSLSFDWSADSHMVVFGDILHNDFSVIAVIFDNDGSTKAYEHPVRVPQVCGKPVSQDFGIFIEHAAITTEGDGQYAIKTNLRPTPGVCEPQNLKLRFPDDFTASTVEKSFEHHFKWKRAVVDR